MNTNIPRIKFPELFFGLVAPIGAEQSQVVQAFKTYFQSSAYTVIDIKVTHVFELLKKYIQPETTLQTFPPEARYSSYIKYGDQLREAFQDASILAKSTIANVIHKRQKLGAKFERTIYLLHQFKRREEIELLRSVYGDAFFQVSIYSRRGARVENLARKFAAAHSTSNVNSHRSAAEGLVETDENENNLHGQEVGKIFHDADFIVNLDQHTPNVDQQVSRFCELIFSSNQISPSKMEHGMFLAKGAALRSLDLSRQVGACILDKHGQIICLGANEVPKAGGGTYWADEVYDDRDFKRGGDSNEYRKKEVLAGLLKALNHTKKVDEVLADPEIENSQFMAVLEYSRVIHAEMNAICDAARLGRSLQDATLYCTTFPCHLCAKQIVASGLANVVFLEPYPKSLAVQLNSDSLQVEGGDRGQYAAFPSVQFNHFFGVTPRRYQQLFLRRKRKDKHGTFLEYADGKKQPLIDLKSPFYTQSEVLVLSALKEQYKENFVDEDVTTQTGEVSQHSLGGDQDPQPTASDSTKDQQS